MFKKEIYEEIKFELKNNMNLNLKLISCFLLFLTITSLIFWGSLHDRDYINTGSFLCKEETYFYKIKVNEKITKTALSKYLVDTNLNMNSNWIFIYQSRSFFDNFRAATGGAGFMNSKKYLYKSTGRINFWLGTFEDISNPKNIDYQMVRDKVVEFLEIIKADDKIRLEKFMEELYIDG